MRVLLLSPYGENIARVIKDAGDEVHNSFDGGLYHPDFIVMFGWRKILKGLTLHFYKEKIINIHASLLPWNRGAHPNFWSWYDDTPKGVSIHFVDEGVDTGPIIASEMTFFDKDHETLKSTYDHLLQQAEGIFERMWPAIRRGTTGLRQAPESGSFHKKKDLEPIWPKLSKGWDTPVAEVMKLGVEARNARSGSGHRAA